MAIIWAMVYGTIATGITCGLALWLLPSSLFVAKRKIAPDDAAPPPWHALNRPGRILYALFVGSAALLMILLLVGVLIEG